MGAVIALAGNQNCGKSTLFNALTGKKQKVGNFPGVTVELTEGGLRGEPNYTVVDLPGLYSMSAFSPEERASADYLVSRRPDAVVNVLDANNLQRNLYLTLQLSLLGIPVVAALNMIDEARESGIKIDAEKLSGKLGMAVVEVCALTGEGIPELISAVKRAKPTRDIALNRASIDAMLAQTSGTAYERYETIMRSDEVFEQVVEARYAFIDAVCAQCVGKSAETVAAKRTRKIDGLVTGKYTAVPIFALLVALSFYLSFSVVGGALGGLAERAVKLLTDWVYGLLCAANADDLFIAFVCDGVLGGVGTVARFFPTVVSVLFFLSLLEDCGYMARAAYFFDRPLSKIGLSGRCIVPFVLGLGCTAPAAMSAKTIRSKSERLRAALLCCYIPCSAKFVVFSLICTEMFGAKGWVMMLAVYAADVAVLVAVAAVSSKLSRAEPREPFVIELPVYRFPSAANVFSDIMSKTRSFAGRIAGAVLTVSVLIWAAGNFDFSLSPVSMDASVLAELSRRLAKILEPLGLADWRAAAALLCGLVSKEAVAGCLGIVAPDGLGTLFSPASATAFLMLVALTAPCAASAWAIKKETGTARLVFMVYVLQSLIAYCAAYAAYIAALAILWN